MPPTAVFAIVAISVLGGRVLDNGRIAASWQLFASPKMSGIANPRQFGALRLDIAGVDMADAALSSV